MKIFFMIYGDVVDCGGGDWNKFSCINKKNSGGRMILFLYENDYLMWF